MNDEKDKGRKSLDKQFMSEEICEVRDEIKKKKTVKIIMIKGRVNEPFTRRKGG